MGVLVEYGRCSAKDAANIEVRMCRAYHTKGAGQAMNKWISTITPENALRYLYDGNPAYSLRRVRSACGNGISRVWALHHGESRVWEVQALSAIEPVAHEAEEYIRADSSDRSGRLVGREPR